MHIQRRASIFYKALKKSVASIGFLAIERGLGWGRGVVAYQVSFCVKCVHAIDENGTADNAILELWRHDSRLVYIYLAFRNMMANKQTYLSADARRTTDREVFSVCASICANRVLHGGGFWFGHE
jgi:hypothetical protein